MKKTENQVFYYLTFMVALWFVSSCTNDKHDVDVSAINVNLNVVRFDRELWQCKQGQGFETCEQQLSDKYGFFYQSYLRDIMGFRRVSDATPAEMLNGFLENEDMAKLYKDVQEKYADMSAVEAGLVDMMKHFKYYFPKEKEPTIVTFVAPFQYANVFYYDTIGVGLDLYMGPDYEYYPTVESLPAYKIKKTGSEYIIPGVTKALVNMKFPEPPSQQRFLDIILYEGKVLYFLDAFLPDMHDTLKIGYSKKQLDWCFDNEAQMWAHYIDTELLYSTDVKHYIRYLNDGPFTTAPGVPPESAPMIGIWSGWRIVRSYMKAHPEVTLQQLMDMNDAERILKESGYKPN